jgi:hypothetical protein
MGGADIKTAMDLQSAAGDTLLAGDPTLSSQIPAGGRRTPYFSESPESRQFTLQLSKPAPAEFFSTRDIPSLVLCKLALISA